MTVQDSAKTKLRNTAFYPLPMMTNCPYFQLPLPQGSTVLHLNLILWGEKNLHRVRTDTATSKLSKIAIIIQCITYNPSSLLFAKERKETLPNPGAKPYLREWSSELESTNIWRDSWATGVVTLCWARDTSDTGQSQGKRDQLSPGLTKSPALASSSYAQQAKYEKRSGHGTHSSRPVMSASPEFRDHGRSHTWGTAKRILHFPGKQDHF